MATEKDRALPLGSAIQITVTSTATDLQSLLNTANTDAGTDAQAGDPRKVMLNAEGNVRFAFTDNPTTSTGIKLNEDETLIFDCEKLDELNLIAASNTAVNVQVFKN